MKTLAIAMILAIAATTTVDAGPQDDVLSAIRARLDASARNDTKAWSTVVDDQMLAPLEGERPSKRAWIATHESQPREVTYWYGALEDPKVRLHGDTAVVTYHARQFTKVGEQTTSVHKWQIETLVRADGRWLLVGVADGLIPPEPAAIAVDARTLDTYVGDYEWAPTLVSKVRRRGGSLFEEFPTQGESELGAESPATFFIKGAAASGDASRIIFVKDTAGRVTHYIYRELGATDRIVKKVR